MILETPALVVHLDILQANIDAMAAAARAGGTRLRPHIKSHKSPEIAGLQLDAGAGGVTCATLEEAETMADAGCRDILLAYPVWGDAKLDRLRALKERVSLRVSLDSVEVAERIGTVGLPVLVDVDTGHGRLGRPAGRATADLVAGIDRVKGVEVVGLCSHAGHSYRARDQEELRRIAEREVADLADTARLCGGGLEVSVGATPTARWQVAADEVTEIRPGTYVFNDSTMIGLGVAGECDCAARVLTTVVATPAPDRFVVDAGTKALAADGTPGHIRVADRPDLRLSFLNEEHGVGHAPPEARPRIGDRLELVPNHICPVSNLFDRAHGLLSGRVEREFPITAHRRSRRCEG